MTSEEIQQIFFAECDESLGAAEAGLAACKAGTQDDDTVNAVFRAVHSIKGGAGAFGFAALQAYTHTFETLLSDVRDGSVPLAEPLINLLLRALDVLSDHVATARDGGELPDDAGLIAEMTAAQAANGGTAGGQAPVPSAPGPEMASEPASVDAAGSGDADPPSASFDDMLDDIMGFMGDAPAPAGWQLHLRPRASAMCNGGEPLLMLRELIRLGGRCMHCDMEPVPNLDQFDATQGYLGWTFEMPGTVAESAVRDIFDFVSEDYALAFGVGAALPPAEIVAVPEVPAASPVAANLSWPRAGKPRHRQRQKPHLKLPRSQLRPPHPLRRLLRVQRPQRPRVRRRVSRSASTLPSSTA